MKIGIFFAFYLYERKRTWTKLAITRAERDVYSNGVLT